MRRAGRPRLAGMSRAGPTFVPALATLVIAGGVLFFSEANWLRLTAAIFLLAGIALGVAAIATPEFLAADADAEADEDERDGGGGAGDGGGRSSGGARGGGGDGGGRSSSGGGLVG